MMNSQQRYAAAYEKQPAATKLSRNPVLAHYTAQSEIATLTVQRDALAAALRELELSANTVARCYTHRPENFAMALKSLAQDAEAARAVLSTATTAPVQS